MATGRASGSRLNTVAALTYHINYYLAGILNVFKSGTSEIKDQYSFDLPPIHSEADWNKLLEEFLANSAAFADEVTQMPDEKLDTSSPVSSFLR